MPPATACADAGPVAAGGRSPPSSAPAQALLLAGDGLGQLLLVHLRPPLDPEPLGPVEQRLAGVADHVDAAEGLAALAGGPAALGRLRVRRALLLLGLPAVSHLLER